MDTQQLEYFLDVAQTEHMTKSAHRLHVAQPALSRQIARLEDELGVPLFDRVGRGLRLTDAGRAFQAGLEPICRDLARLKAEVTRMGAGEPCALRIRVGAASRIAADALAQWAGRAGRPAVSLTQAAQAAGEEVDVVIDSEPPSGCARTCAFSERVMLAVPAGWDVAKVPIRLADVAGEGFISLSASSGFCRFTQELCREAGFEPRVSLESDNPSVVRKMIGLGLGVGFWPEFSWGEVEGGEVALVPLDVARRREVHVGLARQAEGNVDAEALYEHFRRSFAECFGA